MASSPLNVNESLAGKTLLITGTTGFLGKVLLEKFLRETPEVRKMFLLIRGKNPVERFENDILNSKLFQMIQEKRSDFYAFARSKCVPIRGDVMEEGLGLSKDDLAVLGKEVNLVIHCAATVDFKEKLNDAIKKNVLGTLELFEISKAFAKIEGFLHVSTAYVNCHREGRHEEVLPTLNFDPEEMVQLILQMDPNELEKRTPSIIGNFPNTYTFSKAITERILDKRKGKIPITIVRPTIIGASVSEPNPGWIDSINAVGAVILYAGVGIVTSVQGDHKLITDIVPVDSVSNVIVAAAGATLHDRNLKQMEIYHAGTSSLNPVRWFEVRRWVLTYWNSHNVKRRITKGPIDFKMYLNPWEYEFNFFLNHELPAFFFNIFAKTVGTEAQRKNADMLRKINYRTRQTTETFYHFTHKQWIFDTRRTEELLNRLTEEQKPRYEFYVSGMDWERYFRFFSYGMQRFIMKEEVKPPTELLKIDLVNQPRKQMENTLFTRMFPDLAWAYKNYKTNIGIDNFNTLRTTAETKDLIIKGKPVQDVIKKLAEKEGISTAKIEARAHAVLDRMTHTLRLPIVRMFAFFLKKLFKQMFQGIHVDERGLEQVRKAYSQGPLILIPTHRSYLDFLIVSYIFFEYDMPLPHIAAGEDFLGIIFVNWVFRNSGAFFLRRSFKGDELYTTLFSEYVQRLVCDWSPIEFFIEGKRSRTGKSLHPKFGLLGTTLEPYFHKKVPDLTLVPISIAYEKVVEAELHSNELLGEKKVKESFEGLIGSARRVLSANYGRINVVFNEPISVKNVTQERMELLSKGVITREQSLPMEISPKSEISPKTPVKFDPFHNEQDQKQLVSDVAYRIVHDLNKGIVVTATSIVATIIMNQRKGISHDDLLTKAEWLREEITQRGHGVACEGITQDLVENGLKILSSLVMNVRNVYTPYKSSERGKKNKSALALDLYRNQLIHIFPLDGMISIALCSHVTAHDEGVPKETLLKDCQFLSKLFWLEFVTKPDINVEDNFAATLSTLLDRGILKEKNGNIIIAKEGDAFIAFLSNMFWPLLDCYWVATVALFAMHPNVNLKLGTLLQRTQLIAEKMFSEGKLSFYESCSSETLQNAFQLLSAWDVIKIQSEAPVVAAKKGAAKAPVIPTVSLAPKFQSEAALSDLVERIQRLRKPGEVVDGPAKLKRAMIYDFPVLAKL